MTSKEISEGITQTSHFSLPVFSILGAVLVVLKVLGKITLAWKWVLAPFWIPPVAVLGILVLVFGVVAIAVIIAALID